MSQDPVLSSALDKWSKAVNGQRPIISHRELDALSDHFQVSEDQEAATLYFKHSRTIPNPNRVGTLDTFVLFI